MVTQSHKVKAGQTYIFRASGWDLMMPQHYTAHDGQRVRVINLPSAPKANTMGQCHIEDAQSRAFLGMVSVASLTKD